MKTTAYDMIKSLFNPTDDVNFRILDDKKRGMFTGTNLSCKCAEYNSFEEQLKQHNAMDRGIFFVVNSGGDNDASITRINAQFFEMDEGTFEEQQKKIDAFPLPPSIVAKTRKSLHVYYLMDGNAKVERFRTIQKQLVKQFGGDPVCINESRVMRLPGFNHCKQDPVEVTCICFHPELKYSQDQLADALPALEEQPAEERSGAEQGLARVLHSCDFLEYCKTNAVTLPEHDWYAMITNLAPFAGGVEMIHTLSAPYPGYTPEETRKKINHFLKSGTKPITCQTICEKGYQCPKLASGACKARAPAALSHIPLSADDLTEILDRLPITGKAVKDSQTAEKFVREYLYNQDEITATTMISSEICGHFRMSASAAKPLKSALKSAQKSYQASAHTKAKLATPLPDWYEPTDRGVRLLPGVLAEELAKTQHTFFAAGQYYRYQNGVYCEMTETEAQRIVRGKMLPQETRMTQIIDVEKQWRLLIQRDIRELNANPYIINVRNGLYNVLEDKLSDHTPEYYSTVQLNASYDKTADCPRFRQFLAESMDGDAAQVALLQEMLGYCLIPINSAQKCFVIVGAAGAGKSVLLRVLNDILLGKQNVSNVSWQALNERFKTAELFGKLANILADLPTKNIDDNGIFKALVGEDYLTVEKKNRDPFSFQSTAKLIFSCNSIPKNYGDRSEGFYRRLIIVRFKNAVPEDKRDPDLLLKFQQEADGIFLFALEGLRRLMQNSYRFSVTQTNLDELQQYREESDSVLAFVKESCELDVAYATGSTELYNAYTAYCTECGMKPCAQRKFVQQMRAAFPNVNSGVDKLGRRRVINGVKLGAVLS